MLGHCRLRLSSALLSEQGQKARNDDTVIAHIPDEPLLTTKGAVFLIADGLSSAECAQQASRLCAEDFIQSYYHTPEMWSVATAVQNTLLSINAALYRKNHAFQDPARGYASTLTLLVIKSHYAYLFHVGDSRAYLLRDQQLERLTTDHTELGGKHGALTRAMGVSLQLQIDHRTLALQEQDLLLLSTDGLHDSISQAAIEQVVADESVSLQQRAQQLGARALSAGSSDNISCLLVRATELSSEGIDELKQMLHPLPFPPPLSPGHKIDGYRVDRELHASTRSQLYLVTDMDSQQQLVMKTPSINFDYDQGYIDRFCLEEWVGRRLNCEHVVKVITPPRKKSFLYFLMEYVPGMSLQRWMEKNPRPGGGTVLALAQQMAAGVQALHNREILHRDLKPGNIMIDRQGRVKIVDLGSIYVASVAEIQSQIDQSELLGTMHYSAPEYTQGQGSQPAIDQFSLAIIIYEMLTHQHPYGRGLGKCRQPRDFKRLRYQPSFKYREDIPVWFDGALRKAAAIDPAERYDSLASFIDDLAQPNPYFLSEEYLQRLEETLPRINLSLAFGLLWGGSLLLALLVFVL